MFNYIELNHFSFLIVVKIKTCIILTGFNQIIAMNKGAGSGSCPRMRSGFLYTHYRCEYRLLLYTHTHVIHISKNTYAFTMVRNRYCLNTLKS